ncbi:ETT1 [Candida jiufengensis]|uniref:ETT1 n=1 Tax=Candida jiufengensis TaxID=497108 RepID=UPI0022244D76|nr:ETT1 [Candida jiufengensis]KAI5951293.1 ETT1 [Candida jiufengensis]
MAKRTLGLRKAAKAKKQKVESTTTEETSSQPVESSKSNELTIELPEGTDSNDEISELKGLYKTYIDSERDNELIVNGIIHECDRILRNHKDDQTLPPIFYKIYSIALSELTNFHTDDLKQIKEFFEASLERIDDGLEKYPKDIELLFTKSKILLNQIILQYVSQLDLESKLKEDNNIAELLDNALEIYQQAEDKADELENYEAFNNEEYLDILESVDDILEIIDDFGKEEKEEEEKEEEEEEEEEQEVLELPETHPLYPIQNTDEYNEWWRDHTITYLNNLKKLSTPQPKLLKTINQRLGQSFLQESEGPTNIYITLKFDDDYEGIEELEGLSAKEALSLSQNLIEKALEHLKEAKDEDEPESWVTIAEAMITLGNLYDVESKEQDNLYEEAEELLRKANNVTNGKYQEALDNLLAKDEDEE